MVRTQMKLYLQGEISLQDPKDERIFKGLNLESFVSLYVLQYLGILDEKESSNGLLRICFLPLESQRDLSSSSTQKDKNFFVQLSECTVDLDVDTSKALDVTLPALHIPEENYYISGLCGVLRHVISGGRFKGILGHNGGNLSSPAEVSTWTRFVEVDLPGIVRSPVDKGEIPRDLAKFEIHMRQPVKIHNIRKRIKESHKGTEGQEDPIIEYARINHVYCEGPDLLLSDLIVYPMIYFISKKYSKSLFDALPTLHRWFKDTMGQSGASALKKIERGPDSSAQEMEKLDLQEAPAYVFPLDMDDKTSLYKCDPRRNNPKARVYTRQNDIDNIMAQLDIVKLHDKVIPKSSLDHVSIDWSSLPPDIHPKSGGLPPNRLEKKCQQLECIYHAVKSLGPKKDDVIVDFCCGGGHLSLLLAHLFPECQVYLVENKFESLRRAKQRASKLNNITFFQCNMDYFVGRFNMGLSLHACGIATDLVLSRCLSEKAKFVSCPCCYGSIADNHVLQYPRSKDFENSMSSKEFYILCHAADQVHPEGSDNSVEKCAQGRIAMDLVDSDRLLEAQDAGYKVRLSQLMPPSCTPKNNLLIGDLI